MIYESKDEEGKNNEMLVLEGCYKFVVDHIVDCDKIGGCLFHFIRSEVNVWSE